MKTYRQILIGMLFISITSCETYQQMNTRINPDGTIEREVLALADSAFMAGNTKKNPFLIQQNDNWQLTRYDSVFTRNIFTREQEFNTRLWSSFSSFEDYNLKVIPEEYMAPLVKPIEKLEKKFRWFYTYYTYTAVFPDLTEILPVPLDIYLNEREQLIYFQGDLSAFEGMNGIEQGEILDGLANEFQTWLTRCEFELTMDAIFSELRLAGEVELINRLSGVNDTLYHLSGYNPDNWVNVNTFIAPLIDEYLGDNLFSAFFDRHAGKIEERVEEKTEILDLFLYRLGWGVEMPGSVIKANTNLHNGRVIIWNVDAYRFLAHNYILEAGSRVFNVWSFIITILLLGVGLVLVKKYRRFPKRNGRGPGIR